MHKLFGAVAFAALFALSACSGVVTDPTAEVTTIQLYADDLGALLSQECVSLYKEEGCSRYPNPLACDQMEITVRGDGRTCAVCQVNGETPSEFCGGPADGIPLLCHATPDTACQQCVDVFGNTVFDNCNRGAMLFRAREGGWSQVPGEGSGWLDPPTDPGQQPPPSTSGGKCDPEEARKLYAKELNAILAKEGLKFSYSPDLGKKYDTKKGYWGYGGYNPKKDMCQYWLTSNSHLTTCWSNEPNRCHCRDSYSKYGKTCRCARINVFALRAACHQIPKDCEYKDWVANLVMEYGVATKWLFSGNYGKGYYGGLPSYPGDIPGNGGPKCLGSPLVLDLGGDGVATTTVQQGVRFDLMGHGPMDTAWVAGGDDALLVLDRDGNGRIDNGTELFGAATDIGGVPADDGFEALALLDSPAQGGNGNGLLEAGDLMFGELRLWQDEDRDGRSRPEELRSLSDAGVEMLELRARRTTRAVLDESGNDQSLRAAYGRADGSRGLLVDVLFGVGR